MGIKFTQAKEIVEEIVRFSSQDKQGRPSSIAVVDEAGVLVCFARMDGASPLTARMAMNKAYTAIDWKRDTKDIQAFIKENNRDITWFGDSRHAPIPGGVLLKTKTGTTVGAIGTSGRTAEEDEEQARVGEKVWNTLLDSGSLEK